MNRFSKLCALCAALVMSIATYAQSSLLATLSHVEDGETTISTFYGKGGFAQAVEAAVKGDIITLSAGQFSSCSVRKNITIRGAGCSAVAANYNMPTKIDGIIDLGAVVTATFENIALSHISGSNANASFFTFNKCYIGYLSISRDTRVNINNSVITGTIEYYSNNSNMAVTLTNSIFGRIACSNNGNTLMAENCFIYQNPNYMNTVLRNCIIVTRGENLNESLNAYNCVAIGDSPEGCFNGRGENNNVVSGYGIFKKYAEGCDLLDPSNFELTAEAAGYYKGTDGKQVGLFGGSLPFDLTPMLPRITRLDTAPMSTTDGKLRVNIQVEVPTPSSAE